MYVLIAFPAMMSLKKNFHKRLEKTGKVIAILKKLRGTWTDILVERILLPADALAGYVGNGVLISPVRKTRR